MCLELRIYFVAHTHNVFLRNRVWHQKSFPDHPEVAVLILRWHAALVSEGDANRLPRQIMRDRRKPGVNRPRRVPARERNSEFVAFADGLVRLSKNEVRGVRRETFGSNNVATHSRWQSDRAM